MSPGRRHIPAPGTQGMHWRRSEPKPARVPRGLRLHSVGDATRRGHRRRHTASPGTDDSLCGADRVPACLQRSRRVSLPAGRQYCAGRPRCNRCNEYTPSETRLPPARTAAAPTLWEGSRLAPDYRAAYRAESSGGRSSHSAHHGLRQQPQMKAGDANRVEQHRQRAPRLDGYDARSAMADYGSRDPETK